MRSRRLASSICTSVVLAASLAGCGAAAAPPAADPAAADPGPVTITLAVATKLAGHWPVWIGTQTGLFERNGVTLEVSTIQTDTAGVQALQSDSVDLIIGTIPQMFHANEAGADLVGIAAVQNRPIYRMIGGRDVTGLEDLRGRSVGVSEIALGIDSYLVQEWLQLSGLAEQDYQLVGTGGVATRVAALTSGGVDLIAVPPPGDVPVLTEGYTDLGLASDTVEHLQWTFLVANRERLDERGAALRTFLASYVEAAAYLQDPANREAAEAALVAETGTTPEAAAAAYDLMVTGGGVSADALPDPLGIDAWEPLLDGTGLAEALFTAEYLPAG